MGSGLATARSAIITSSRTRSMLFPATPINRVGVYCGKIIWVDFSTVLNKLYYSLIDGESRSYSSLYLFPSLLVSTLFTHSSPTVRCASPSVSTTPFALRHHFSAPASKLRLRSTQISTVAVARIPEMTG